MMQRKKTITDKRPVQAIFTARRPLREAQGSPQGRVTWAFSFGSVFFHAKENEQNATLK